MKLKYVSIVLMIIVLAALSPVHAQWSSIPTLNTPVDSTSSTQQFPSVVADGGGGYIVVWQDDRDVSAPSTPGLHIYAQKLNTLGKDQWALGGVAVAKFTGDQHNPVIASDGIGGAIIAWQDLRSGVGAIYVQHLDPDDTPLWQSGGVPVCVSAGAQSSPQIIADGSGGAIIMWEDTRNGTLGAYGQRISAGGTLDWESDGVALSAIQTGNQTFIQAVTDGSGGAFFTWKYDGDPGDAGNIYAQHVNAGGTIVWTNGYAVCAAAGVQTEPVIIQDDAHGAIISWQDHRSTSNAIYIQRLDDFLGMPVTEWQAGGLQLAASASGDQTAPSISVDGKGGAVVSWQDTRDGGFDIYAQRVVSSGISIWNPSGVRVTASGTGETSPEIVSTGIGGAIVLWYDSRNFAGDSTDIYGQRLDDMGNLLWNATGIPVATSPANQQNFSIVPSTPTGVVLAWQEVRTAAKKSHIYAQNVNSNGSIGFGAVTGMVFDDANRNGVRDSNETVLKAWTVTLGGVVTASTTTDTTGTFYFDGLYPGAYTLTDVVRAGWVQTTPALTTVPVNLDSIGGVYANAPFGLFQLASISGMVYNDVNRNSVLNTGDNGVAGFTVRLNSATVAESTATDSKGNFSFIGLTADSTYAISLAPRDTTIITSTPLISVTVTDGQQVTGINFGAFHKGGVTGTVYTDANLDSSTVGDTALAGVPVKLFHGDTLLARAVSSSKGTYLFVLPDTGIYSVEESLAVGYRQSIPQVSARGYSTITYGANAGPRAYLFSLPPLSRDTIATQDFGNYRLVQFSGTVYVNAAGDSTAKDTSRPLVGWPVHLYEGGVLVGSTFSNSAGIYSFTGILPGTYTVEESLAANYSQTYPKSITKNAAIGAVNPTDGAHVYTTTVASSGQVIWQDFGNFLDPEFTGHVYQDVSPYTVDTSTYAASKAGVANWEVKLTYGATVIDSLVTNSAGVYDFAGIWKGSGSYQVTAFPESGWDSTSVQSTTQTVTTSGTVVTSNFGNYLFRSVSGYVYSDQNNDGKWESGAPTFEPGLPNWQLVLIGKDTTYYTTTNSSGAYRFSNINLDSYTVQVINPSGWNSTSPSSLTVTDLKAPHIQYDFGVYNPNFGSISGLVYYDMNADGAREAGEAGVAHAVVKLYTSSESFVTSIITDTTGSFIFLGLPSGSYIVKQFLPSDSSLSLPHVALPQLWRHTTVDSAAAVLSNTSRSVAGLTFGEFMLGRISGQVFGDLNGNGRLDGSETGKPGILVRLGGNATDSIYTDAQGHFMFTSLLRGSYTLSPAVDDSIVVSGASPLNVSLPADSSDVLASSIGVSTPGEIEGYVYYDQPPYGARNTFDSVLAGVTVLIHGGRNDSIKSDSTGHFIFSRLRPGSYSILERLTASLLETSPVAPDSYAVATLRPGQDTTGLNFWNISGSFDSIKGTVYSDLNGDAIQDDGDPAIIGLRVVISGSSFNDTVLTTATGKYCVPGLSPGVYTVSVVAPAGTYESVPTAASKSYIDTVVLGAPAMAFSHQDFAFFPSMISGHVFLDSNGDSLQDDGEGAITGSNSTRHMQLTGPSPLATVRRATTDVNGLFAFTALPPGTYSLLDSVPSGWERTTPSIAQSITLGGSSSAVDTTGISFGEFALVSVSGIEFVDLNRDGIPDNGEQAVDPNNPVLWRMQLFRNGLQVSASPVTMDASTGAYAFSSLGSGSYTLREVSNTSWNQSAPVGTGIYTFRTQSGQNVTGMNFGNYESDTNSITVRMFKDRDGVFATHSDDTAKGWGLALYKDSVSATTLVTPSTTSASTIVATSLVPGTYIAVESTQVGWTNLGSILNGVDHAVSQKCDTIVLVHGTSQLVDFVNFNPNSLILSKLEDVDGVFSSDSDRVNIPWQLTLYANSVASFNKVASAVSSDSLVLNNLGDGKYIAVESDSAGWTPLGLNIDGRDSATPNGQYTVTMSGGQAHLVDFVEMISGTVVVRNFSDNDGNILTAGDQNLKTWGLTLYHDSLVHVNLIDSASAESLYHGAIHVGTYVAGNADSVAAGWIRIADDTNGIFLDTAYKNVSFTVAKGQTSYVEFYNFQSRRSKKWTGASDGTWSNVNNWTPQGSPNPGDTAEISGTKAGLVMPVGLRLSKLTIDSNATLTLPSTGTDTVSGSVIVGGTLFTPPSATPCLRIGGSLDLTGIGAFSAGSSSLIFYGTTDTVPGGTYYNLQIGDTGVSYPKGPQARVRSNMIVQGVMKLYANFELGSDTLTFLDTLSSALCGAGKLVDGTIVRYIQQGSTGKYQFESAGSSLTFAALPATPSRITFSGYANTAPSTFASTWKKVGGVVNTATHTITLDSVTSLNRLTMWSFGTRSANVDSPVVRRVYVLSSPYLSAFNAVLSLRYDSTEIAHGVAESTLVLMNSQFSVSAGVKAGWNLLSVPVAGASLIPTAAFPGESGRVFQFVPDTGYLSRTYVSAGVGYWTKFDSTKTITGAGTYMVSDTVPVETGWNMIGSVSVSTPVANVTSIPNGIILDQLFYGYNPSTGYTTADSLQPFGGYWIKVRQSGVVIVKVSDNLLLSKNAVAALPQTPAQSATLQFTDAAGHSETLILALTDKVNPDQFELPPSPPAGAFDVRFSSQRSLEVTPTASAAPALNIVLQSARLPLTISWRVPSTGGRTITLEDGAAGKYFEQKILSGAGTMTVAKGSDASYLLNVAQPNERPRAYALGQNYPNPFNPTTLITYALPSTSRVSLKVYNILGQEVRTLVEGVETDGYKSIEWNGTNQSGLTLPSGVYFYRLQATSIAGTAGPRDFVDVKKLVLMK